MVKIQIDLPTDVHKFVSVKKALLGMKDRRDTIVHILKETMENEKFLKKFNKVK